MPKNLRDKLVLVTGGCGFIGHHLVQRLLSHGARVRIIDDGSTGRPELVQHTLQRGLATGEVAELVAASVTNSSAVEYAAKGCDIIFHIAGLRFGTPENCEEVNSVGTLCVLEAARKAGINRVITTGCVVSAKEGHVEPADSFHCSKLHAENHVRRYHEWYGMHTITLRLSEVFGASQTFVGQYIIPYLIDIMMKGKDGMFVARPKYARDFCHVENVVDALTLCCSPSLNGSAINIGTGETRGIKAIIKAVKQVLKEEGMIPRLAIRNTDAPWVYTGKVNISKAEKVIGYKPRVNFEAGLRKYIASLRLIEQVKAIK